MVVTAAQSQLIIDRPLKVHARLVLVALVLSPIRVADGRNAVGVFLVAQTVPQADLDGSQVESEREFGIRRKQQPVAVELGVVEILRIRGTNGEPHRVQFADAPRSLHIERRPEDEIGNPI